MNNLPPDLRATIDAMEPTFQAEFLRAIEPIDSPGQLAAIATHLSNGAAVAAMIVASADPVIYSDQDFQIRQAFALGRAGRL